VQIEITQHTEKRRIELKFSTTPPDALIERLLLIGFRRLSKDRLRWDVANRVAYFNYAKELQKSFEQNNDWQGINLHPSYPATIANIYEKRFSIVTYILPSPSGIVKASYVIFEPIKRIATFIAAQYAKQHYKDIEIETIIIPRNEKEDAKKLFEKGKVISPLKKKISTPPKSTLSIQKIKKETELNQDIRNTKLATKTPQINIPQASNNLTNNISISTAYMDNKKDYKLNLLINSVVQELSKESESIEIKFRSSLKDTLNRLLDASDQEHYDTQLQLVKKAIQSYRDQYSSASSDRITFQMLRLMECLGEAPLSQTDKITTPKAIPQQEARDNMIIPKGIGKHFAFHNFKLADAEFLQEQYPHLLKVNDTTLDTTKATSLFELMQLPHPTDYGFAVHRGVLLRHFEQNGMEIFKELHLPTSIDYPYINIHTHYRSVQPLKDIIGLAAGKRHWWSLASNYRPIKDIAIALKHIEAALAQSKAQQELLINPKTQKPKKKSKAEYEDLAYHISRLEQSKDQLLAYKKEHFKTAIPAKTAPAPNGYLCKVVATMHQFYAQKQRLSKKQIEALQHPTHTPTLGKLWEAVELSWLLWYRQLYVQLTPFDLALKAMIQFWNNLQPTYAYSDSSKERFKQYSTPCIIGAMLAQYTQMDRAERIFEPSAGNGLLLVGADPEKTIVNEIDPTRKDSLTEQQFKEVHAKNAAAPFPKAWKKHFDVVVTNPPFAKWEDELFDKKRLVSKYFNKHHELARYMRLEHYMAGLALHTLKDTGKAAIIIMGHLYFDDQGYIAKYAPFYKWLSRHYIIDDIINLNGFKIYAKQGAVARTMLILIGGRKKVPTSNFPTRQTHPHFDTIVDSFEALWIRIKAHIDPLEKIIKQLKIATS